MKNNDRFEFLDLNGPIILKHNIFKDNRGYFVKDYFDKELLKVYPNFQVNETFFSYSKKNVFRGFHFQIKMPQIKIVSCLKGRIIDYLVDLRPNSNNFRKIYEIELSEINKYSVLVPKGFGHGFLALKNSIVTYKCSGDYIKEYDTGIIYNDPTIQIDFSKYKITLNELIISDRDLSFSSIDDIISLLDF